MAKLSRADEARRAFDHTIDEQGLVEQFGNDDVRGTGLLVERDGKQCFLSFDSIQKLKALSLDAFDAGFAAGERVKITARKRTVKKKD